MGWIADSGAGPHNPLDGLAKGMQMAVRRMAWWSAAALAWLAGCASLGFVRPGFVELPLRSGWYEGQPVDYVTTDVSDLAMAREAGANHVPRLAEALPEGPPRPGQRSSVERIYKVVNFNQGSVLPSVPQPVGAGSRDGSYSPLWVIVKVSWQPGTAPRVLRSEEEVLAAAEKGEVALETTRIVVNCPVVRTARGGALPGVR